MEPEMELLAPAGTPEILKAVIDAGADAVYLGGERFGARAYAGNFTDGELLAALDYAHLRGKKLYLTVNTLLKNQELPLLFDYLLPLYKNGLDAVLVQDLGVLSEIRARFPDLPVHTSTQMTVTGAEGVRFLQRYGVTRVVLPREISLAEMKAIRGETGMELEAFVHGALCYSYSGQCLFSSLIGGRSGNRGRCAQPCRLPYALLDEAGQAQTKERYLLSLKDFCNIENLCALRDAGVYSLKIEGRMKQKSYAAGVVSIYRKYLDLALSGVEYRVEKQDYERLAGYGSRCGFTDAYLKRENDSSMITGEKPSFVQTVEYGGSDGFRRPISGELSIKAGEPMSLSVTCGNFSATACGEVPQPAKSSPLTAFAAESRLEKTGDTAFVFREFSAVVEDGLFVPNGQLNQLRRGALDLLAGKILESMKRDGEQPCDAPWDVPDKEEVRPVTEHDVVSTENRAFLPLILREEWVTDVYLDAFCYGRDTFFRLEEDVKACRSRGKRVYFILPPICREKTMRFYRSQVPFLRGCALDGFVVKNYESLWFVETEFPGHEVISDHNLYAYNDRAAAMLREAGVSVVTVPFELNKKEIAHRRNTNGEIWVYGYYPLMTTAQCVCNNTGGCTKTQGVCFLRDRFQKQFPIRNYCPDCCNVIYNSVPTCLFSYLDELSGAHISRRRIHLSVEDAGEAGHILTLYGQIKAGGAEAHRLPPKDSCTNGHYKRGVE